MQKTKGFKCPMCKKSVSEDRNSHHYCKNCNTVFWDLNNAVFKPKKGRGNRCHHCGKLTMHNIETLETEPKINIFRCSTCHAVMITKEL